MAPELIPLVGPTFGTSECGQAIFYPVTVLGRGRIVEGDLAQTLRRGGIGLNTVGWLLLALAVYWKVDAFIVFAALLVLLLVAIGGSLLLVRRIPASENGLGLKQALQRTSADTDTLFKAMFVACAVLTPILFLQWLKGDSLLWPSLVALYGALYTWATLWARDALQP
jgi:hypothetical protein